MSVFSVEDYAPARKDRIRSTNAQLEQLDRQILEVLAADHPQSIRHVFYRKTNPLDCQGRAA